MSQGIATIILVIIGLGVAWVLFVVIYEFFLDFNGVGDFFKRTFRAMFGFIGELIEGFLPIIALVVLLLIAVGMCSLIQTASGR